MKKSLALIAAWSVFLTVSRIGGWDFGVRAGENFLDFLFGMIIVLPPAFILIGLFEVWVEKKTVESGFGKKSGFRGYVWAVLLAGTSVGGLLTALPLASVLYKKGARLSVVLTYIGAAAVARIPMTVFEASFIGLKFSLIRLGVAVPLIIFSSVLLERFMQKGGYTLPEQRES